MFLAFRINFTLKDLEVVSPAYDYFVTKLQEITNGNEPAIKVEKLSTEFTQYFKYDRVKQLVRIRINLFINLRLLFTRFSQISCTYACKVDRYVDRTRVKTLFKHYLFSQDQNTTLLYTIIIIISYSLFILRFCVYWQ